MIKKIYLLIQERRLRYAQRMRVRNNLEIFDKQRELEDKYHACLRQAKSDNDEEVIQAKNIMHTLNFIKWLTQRD